MRELPCPKTPYLIQRGEFKSCGFAYPRISQAIDLDYMGSAEFEFGALPKSLRFLEKEKDHLHVIDVPEIFIPKPRSIKNIPLKVLTAWPADSAEWKYYKEKLIDLRAGKIHTKEVTAFALSDSLFCVRKIDFWWDLDNNTMFSFCQHFRHDILHLLQASWDYMNEKS